MSGKIACAVFAVFVLLGSYWLHYTLPRYTAAGITDAGAKRTEGAPLREATEGRTALDTYFVYVTHEDGSVGVFRNDDTGWGWPPYFKFNAAELQADAVALKGQKVLFRYYGWRVQMLGLFPNILAVSPAPEKIPGISWARLFFFTVWWAVVILLFPRFYRLMTTAPVRKEPDRPAAPKTGNGSSMSAVSDRVKQWADRLFKKP